LKPVLTARRHTVRSPVHVRAETKQADGQKVATSGDSYEKIEEPVRKNWPEGSNVGSQNFAPSGVSEADDFFKSETANPDTKILGTEVGLLDAMRFKGAAPEVINSRLAMLGFIAAIAAEAATGKNVIQQVQLAPVPIAITFALIIVGSLVPIVRGVPRKGNSVFTSEAELWNGRLAMLGIAALFWNAWIVS